MVAVTTHVTTDVAAAPFLWVLPLSLYLITFILVFSERSFIPQSLLLAMQPVLMALVVLTLALDIRTWLTIDVALHLLFFFVTAMICHGLLSATRPAAAYLTRFYFCLSLGGVLGGIFSGLLAPNIFSWIAEYPILIVAAALARPDFTRPQRREALIYTALAAVVVLAVLPGLRQGFSLVPPYNWLVWACAIALAGLALPSRRFPLRIALAVAAVFVITRVYPPNVRQLETVRSFFGVHKIEVTPDGRFRTLRHGMELHGAQRLTTDDGKPATGKPELSTYYHRESPIAEVIDAVQEKKGGPVNMAVIGLGAGLVACLARPQDRLDYYEIDADVIRIAQDPKRFTFIRDCKPDTKIVLGDARLTLTANARYDVIHVDAFSSDSIPVHLLTREALRVYLSRLNPGGIILTHISNNHLDLTDVVAATAAGEGLVSRLWDEDEVPGRDPMIKFSTVMILAKANADFGTLADWDLHQAPKGQTPWSDDYSNLLGPLIKKLREGE
jgi:spermidine synthase